MTPLVSLQVTPSIAHSFVIVEFSDTAPKYVRTEIVVSDGTFVGDFVGFCVGDLTGACVGARTGDKVGLLDGDFEGAADGLGVASRL